MSEDATHSSIDVQLAAAAAATSRSDWELGFTFLERAHVLAQASTYQHVRVHWLMLRWAMRQRNIPEFLGQIVRIIGAACKTVLGLVPSGNTGGANVSPFRTMPIPADLAALLAPQKSTKEARLIVGIAAGIVLIAAAAIGFSGSTQDRTALVNGHRISFRVIGSGRPALVFISGLGDGMATFDAVASVLGKHAAVITYDRAGYGDSDVGPGPRDAKAAEADLFSILAQSGVPGPYILAGHSLGGLYAEYYAAQHPTLAWLVQSRCAAARRRSPENNRFLSTMRRRPSCRRFHFLTLTNDRFWRMADMTS